MERATDWLLTKPWADRKRVFATGGSYGGYMVAWMNGHVPAGRYAAYVCHAGCFDWTAMFADDAFSWHAKELGAYYWNDMAQVNRQSPARLRRGDADPHPRDPRRARLPRAGCAGPGLLQHPQGQGRGCAAAVVPDENHWILKPRNSRQWYGEFFGWLQSHDVGRRKAAAGR